MVRIGVGKGLMAIPFLSCSLFLSAAAGLASAQSPAAALSEYEPALKATTVAGVSAKSFSGAAFHPESKTLYVIDNDNAVVYELGRTGALLRSITTTGITDPEGISYQADDYFLIAEEGLANILRLKLPRTGSGPVAKSSGTSLNIGPNMANSGIEGVSYRPSDKTVFAAKEITPSRLYRITLDGAGVPNASFPDEPFDVSTHGGDIADILALNDGNFILVNQEQDKLEGFGPTGQALSSLALGMSKPEGIAMDTSDGTIYVVGEPQEFSVFKRKPSGVRRDGSGRTVLNGTGFSCSLPAPGPAGTAPVLRYFLPHRASVHIRFYPLDGAGYEVFSGEVDAGEHSLAGDDARAARVGFYRFTAGDYTQVLKTVSW